MLIGACVHISTRVHKCAHAHFHGHIRTVIRVVLWRRARAWGRSLAVDEVCQTPTCPHTHRHTLEREASAWLQALETSRNRVIKFSGLFPLALAAFFGMPKHARTETHTHIHAREHSATSTPLHTPTDTYTHTQTDKSKRRFNVPDSLQGAGKRATRSDLCAWTLSYSTFCQYLPKYPHGCGCK